MKIKFTTITILCVIIGGCATPPSSDPSLVDPVCAQDCSGHLAECSSGFKLFPVVVQKQCNDLYDICIKGCPSRMKGGEIVETNTKTISKRLNDLEALYKAGVISKKERESKRKDILDSL